MRKLLGCFLLIPCLALAEDAAPPAAPATPPAPAPAVAAPAQPSPFEKLDALYAKRDDPASAKELEEGLTAGLKANPEDFNWIWRNARYKWWLSDGLPKGDAKKKLGTEVWQLSEKAIKANPKGIEGY